MPLDPRPQYPLPFLALLRSMVAQLLERAAGLRELDETVAPETFYRFVYPARVVGMALAGLSAASALAVVGAGPRSWGFVLFGALLWPHLAYWHANWSLDSARSERRNMVLDAAMLGAWIPLMHGSLLPSLCIGMITFQDKNHAPYPGLGRQALMALLGSAALVGSLLSAPLRLDTGAAEVLCTLPLLFAYTWFNTYRGAHLMRLVTRQNWELHALRRTDAQTGLHTREHWHERAEAGLRAFHAAAVPACLLLIDIDHFKGINDTHGHTVGDEVIAEVSRVILDSVRAKDFAGRYGGDEFAVIVSDTRCALAQVLAERIRERISALRLGAAPQLRLSASIGVAPARAQHDGLRAWIDHADAALYQAKRLGRNRVVAA